MGRKKKRALIKVNNPNSDDSDWDCSDDEIPTRKGILNNKHLLIIQNIQHGIIKPELLSYITGNKEVDDGDSELYCKRIKRFNVNKYEMGTVEIDDDFIIPRDIWSKLYE